jgi:hypothetical protein
MLSGMSKLQSENRRRDNHIIYSIRLTLEVKMPGAGKLGDERPIFESVTRTAL